MNKITIDTIVKGNLEKAWDYWNNPSHIKNWAFASEDWEAPSAENDLKVGGKFKTVMAAKDKSTSFDFTGTYTAVKENELIEYDMPDGRHVRTEFSTVPEGVKITQIFDPENENPVEMQKKGWQSILENFKKHVESNK